MWALVVSQYNWCVTSEGLTNGGISGGECSLA